MRARVVVPVQERCETALHLCQIVEAVGVEQLLVEVGVEDLDLAVPLLVLGLEVIGPQLGEQRGETRGAPPRPEGRPLVAHHHLGPAVARDGLLEGVDHEAGALATLVHAVADDVAGEVVDAPLSCSFVAPPSDPPAARGITGTSRVTAPITDGQMMDKRR